MKRLNVTMGEEGSSLQKQQQESRAQSEQNRRILIVDDDPEVAEAYRQVFVEESDLDEKVNRMLENFNIEPAQHEYPTFALDVAHSGESAIEQVREAIEQKRPYAVIFMDIRMAPGIDGVQAAERIRDLDERAYIVFVSAYTDYTANEMQCKLNSNMLLLSKPFEVDTVRQMAYTLCTVWAREESLKRNNRRLEAHSRLMEHQATHDSLTKVYNRHYLDTVLEVEFNRTQREWLPIGVLMIDIDWFKRYNDVNGHLLGDQTLHRVAQAIAKQLKRPADFIARYGGEEFSVVLPNTNAAGVRLMAETIRAGVEQLQIHFPQSEQGTWVTVSVGGCCYQPAVTGGMQRYTELIEQADQQLYRAKREGKNCCRFTAEKRGPARK